jgi:DNA-directed RNA polymerase specialized sigma subunit
LINGYESLKEKLKKLSDDELITIIKNDDERSEIAKSIIFERYRGLIIKMAYGISRRIGTDSEDCIGNFNYLLLQAINRYDMKKSKDSFSGYLLYFFRLKPIDDIGKRKGRMVGVPREAPFYFRNWDGVIINDNLFDGM